MTAASPAARWSARPEAAAGRHRGRARRRRRGLQDRPAQPLADGLRQAGRGVRPERRHLRLRHPVVQHDDVDGPADAEHPALLRPVRARGHGERIRDKFARSRKKGMWMGGCPPLGYEVKDRKLVINEAEAVQSAGSSSASSRSARPRSWSANCRRRGRPYQSRQPDRQEGSLPAAEQPGLYR